MWINLSIVIYFRDDRLYKKVNWQFRTKSLLKLFTLFLFLSTKIICKWLTFIMIIYLQSGRYFWLILNRLYAFQWFISIIYSLSIYKQWANLNILMFINNNNSKLFKVRRCLIVLNMAYWQNQQRILLPMEQLNSENWPPATIGVHLPFQYECRNGPIATQCPPYNGANGNWSHHQNYKI